LYNTILFDLDGTLTDPKVGITQSVQYALKKLGIYEEDLENLTRFIGPPLRNSFREYYLLDETRVQKAIEYYREYYSPYGIFENEIYPEIPILLHDLKAAGKILTVATSKPTVFAEKILHHFDIHQYFNRVVGSNLDETRTTKEEVIEYALTTIGEADRKKIVMIGDRKHDIMGAQINRIDSIGVTYGYGSLEELQIEKPTHIVDDVEGLRKLLSA
jgi:phosphoglycolate phosphatase